MSDLRPAVVWAREWWTDGDDDAGCSAVAALTREQYPFGDDHLVAISYGKLIRAAGCCARKLSVALSIVDGNERSAQPIVGLAIAEGPLLPVSALALHMIQLRYINDDSPNAQRNVPIILPLDPDEPVHRLRQILEDARPEVMLGATDFGVAKMINALGTSDTDAPKIHVISFATLLDDFDSSNADWNELTNEYPWPPEYPKSNARVASHICFTSGSSGRPKGCTSSLKSLLSYLHAKNEAHDIHPSANDNECVVFLASSISFDPCFSDVLATFSCNDANALVGATLAIAPRTNLYNSFADCLNQTNATHVLCTPTLWSTISVGPAGIPKLEVVALGGERIPKRIVKRWARKGDAGVRANGAPRLLATYGTTEVCVYQTCGEIFDDDASGDITSGAVGQDVGLPLLGNTVRICAVVQDPDASTSSSLMSLDDVVGAGPKEGLGEIILSGLQLDNISGYWKRPDLSSGKFFLATQGDVEDNEPSMHYRTGDWGYFNSSGCLHVLGRIEGEEGMVKINGVRIELGEIESAIIDDEEGEKHQSELDAIRREIGISETPAFVIACAVTARSSRNVAGESDERISLLAYCVLSDKCLGELGINNLWPDQEQGNDELLPGFLVGPGSVLHTLLRVRTASRVRKGCVPGSFVVIQNIPLTKTGKCDRKRLPSVETCLALPSINSSGPSEVRRGKQQPLRECGNAGPLVSKAIASALNLPSSTEATLSPDSNFPALGGDSLAAIRVVRSLYASHHSLQDGRNLGGKYGQLEGPFSVKHLLSAATLREYVLHLDANGVCAKDSDQNYTFENVAKRAVISDEGNTGSSPIKDRDASILFEALLEATTSGMSTIASHLLRVGADPNFSQQGKDQRLGKISDKRDRKKMFRSSPLHLACIRGDVVLVVALIKHGAKSKVPDAAGGLPLLLNCSGSNTGTDHEEEDERRLQIARILLDYAGVPLSAKDANRQTVLHATARSGHPKLLRYLMARWKRGGDEGEIHIYPEGIKGGRYNWQDRWFRTPVHWCVLNGHVEALSILLEGGCSANPCQPKASIVNRKTSAAVESPLELCERLYGFESEKGRQFHDLLTS